MSEMEDIADTEFDELMEQVHQLFAYLNILTYRNKFSAAVGHRGSDKRGSTLATQHGGLLSRRGKVGMQRGIYMPWNSVDF